MTPPAIGRPAVWRWPIAIAMLTVFGLFAALLGQGGVWLWLSWAALAFPLAVILACLSRSGKAGRQGR
ncbi:MAG TPA: hypothetical protein VHB27_07275 [Rhodopila sp.]|uniref:hypothetical protein n=1 Tax=Rhodopila sp. TaxID=2480087 RepID=UPI002C2BFE8F|nr:hypothetical protein [Rhodopila sp.]HVY15010.1 hypothetical protein [Rhodopila sp.]